jgi:hypothetical protein
VRGYLRSQQRVKELSIQLNYSVYALTRRRSIESGRGDWPPFSHPRWDVRVRSVGTTVARWMQHARSRERSFRCRRVSRTRVQQSRAWVRVDPGGGGGDGEGIVT